MEAGACAAKPAAGYTYARREPEKTALFQVIQQHLLTFEQSWTDKSDGRTLPSFVTGELHSSHRSQCVPVPVPQTQPEQADKPGRSLPLSLYISWSELLRRTFQIDMTCPRWKSPLRLISLIKTDETIKKILTADGPSDQGTRALSGTTASV